MATVTEILESTFFDKAELQKQSDESLPTKQACVELIDHIVAGGMVEEVVDQATAVGTFFFAEAWRQLKQERLDLLDEIVRLKGIQS